MPVACVCTSQPPELLVKWPSIIYKASGLKHLITIENELIPTSTCSPSLGRALTSGSCSQQGEAGHKNIHRDQLPDFTLLIKLQVGVGPWFYQLNFVIMRHEHHGYLGHRTCHSERSR